MEFVVFLQFTCLAASSFSLYVLYLTPVRIGCKMHLWAWQWSFPQALKIIATIQGLKHGKIKPWSLYSSKCCGRSGICCVNLTLGLTLMHVVELVLEWEILSYSRRSATPLFASKILGNWIPVTPLYSLVSGEQTETWKQASIWKEAWDCNSCSCGECIQKQNRLNLQCNWEASGQVHVQRWDASCTIDTLSNAGLCRFVKVCVWGGSSSLLTYVTLTDMGLCSQLFWLLFASVWGWL